MFVIVIIIIFDNRHVLVVYIIVFENSDADAQGVLTCVDKFENINQ